MTSTVRPMISTNLMPYAVEAADSKWHPAIKVVSGDVWYWPNITLATEDEAADWTKVCIVDAQLRAQEEVNNWNIFPL